MEARRVQCINLLVIRLFEISLLVKLICNKSRFIFFTPFAQYILQAVDFHLGASLCSLFPGITIHLVSDVGAWQGEQPQGNPFSCNDNNNSQRHFKDKSTYATHNIPKFRTSLNLINLFAIE